MIRISRIINKNKVADLVQLPFISKVTLRKRDQGFRNTNLCKVQIYVQVPNDVEYFDLEMQKIIEWGKQNHCDKAVTTASRALHDKFIKESAFSDFDYPIPERYSFICRTYTDNYFNLFKFDV